MHLGSAGMITVHGKHDPDELFRYVVVGHSCSPRGVLLLFDAVKRDPEVATCIARGAAATSCVDADFFAFFMGFTCFSPGCCGTHIEWRVRVVLGL